MEVHHLDRDEARRIAVRAQLLDAPRPTDLVAWSRLGSAYQQAHLQRAEIHPGVGELLLGHAACGSCGDERTAGWVDVGLDATATAVMREHNAHTVTVSGVAAVASRILIGLLTCFATHDGIPAVVRSMRRVIR